MSSDREIGGSGRQSRAGALPPSEISASIASAIAAGMRKVLDESHAGIRQVVDNADRTSNTILASAKKQNESLVQMNKDLIAQMETMSRSLAGG